MQKKIPAIILASASPRRAELLKSIGLKYKIIVSDIDESNGGILSPVRFARKLAEEKALAVQRQTRNLTSIIISGDTIVVLGKEILGKPVNKKEAGRMLQKLSGKTHLVITAVCVLQGKKKKIGHEITRVTFRQLTSTTIQNYLLTKEPMDKAGAYAIQGMGSLLVKKIEGDYFNVMGLPLGKLAELLKSFGITLL